MAAAAVLAGDNEQLIKIVGIRPGEKRHEDLMHVSEPMRMLRSGGHYYELLPRALADQYEAENVLSAPQTCASHTPFGGWVTTEQMKAWIADARGV